MRRTALVLMAILGLAACAPSHQAGPVDLAERYCYRTLGAVDCHAAPLDGEAYRLVGYFDVR